MRKIIIFSLFLMLYVVTFNANSQTTDTDIVFVLEKGKSSSIARHLYKYLTNALKRDYKKSVNIDFTDINEAQAIKFSEYLAVIVVNQKNNKELNSNILDFVAEHKKEKNLLVVALLPRGDTLQKKYDIDVLSSASAKPSAVKLVETQLAPKLNDMMKQLLK